MTISCLNTIKVPVLTRFCRTNMAFRGMLYVKYLVDDCYNEQSKRKQTVMYISGLVFCRNVCIYGFVMRERKKELFIIYIHIYNIYIRILLINKFFLQKLAFDLPRYDILHAHFYCLYSIFHIQGGWYMVAQAERG